MLAPDLTTSLNVNISVLLKALQICTFVFYLSTPRCVHFASVKMHHCWTKESELVYTRYTYS